MVGKKNRLNSHDVRRMFVFCGLVPQKRADDSVQAVRDEKIRLNSHTFSPNIYPWTESWHSTLPDTNSKKKRLKIKMVGR